jgi:hypothetical protein
LGAIIQPEDLTMAVLDTMSTDCARFVTAQPWISILMKAFVKTLSKLQLVSVTATCTISGFNSTNCIKAVVPLIFTGGCASAWTSMVASIYLTPFGITDSPFSLNADTGT